MLAHATIAAVSEVAEDVLVREWRALLARHAAVYNALETELRQRHCIGVSEFEALERLAGCEMGKCRGSELTDTVHLSQSAASRLVARMERDGLVERSMCEMDRRGIFVVLTEKGRERYLEAKPTHRAVLAATMS
ncbi:MarR family transcriptional regulator [Pseudonocardia aurantiaca]